MPAHKHDTEAIIHEDEPLNFTLTDIHDRLGELEKGDEVRDLLDEISSLKSRLVAAEKQAGVTMDLLKLVVGCTNGIDIESDINGRITVCIEEAFAPQTIEPKGEVNHEPTSTNLPE